MLLELPALPVMMMATMMTTLHEGIAEKICQVRKKEASRVRDDDWWGEATL
jgi:hypothetical protein